MICQLSVPHSVADKEYNIISQQVERRLQATGVVVLGIRLANAAVKYKAAIRLAVGLFYNLGVCQLIGTSSGNNRLSFFEIPSRRAVT